MKISEVLNGSRPNADTALERAVNLDCGCKPGHSAPSAQIRPPMDDEEIARVTKIVPAEQEVWKDIVGYEGYYQVSSVGRIRSLERTVATNGGGTQKLPVRIMCPSNVGNGRRMVNLSANGKKKMCYVAPLVAVAFIGPKPNGYFCCHNDGDCENNRVENLRWDRPSGNSADMKKHGTLLLGERNHKSKLNSRKVREIFTRSKTEPCEEIAKRFGVSASQIWRILSGQNWSHVTKENCDE